MASIVGGIAASALALRLYGRIAWPWVPLGWVALVPWLAALDRGRTARYAVGAALGMCAAFVLAVFGWFAAAIRDYTGVPAAVAILLLVVLAPLLEPQLLAFALARHVARRRGVSGLRAAIGCACAWVGAEWIAPKLFADTLGHGLYPSPWMRQAADVAGVGGLTLVLLVANDRVLAAARAIAGRRIGDGVRAAAAAGVLALALAGYGALRCREIAGRPTGASVTAGVVQADLSHYDRLAAEEGKYNAVRRILDTHFALSDELLAQRSIDVLVWPETVYPTTFGSPKSPDGAAFDHEIERFVAHAGVPLVFGAYDAKGADEFNAAFVVHPGSADRAVYRKASLFPLTEHVPPFLESGVVRRWLPWLGTWKPGTGPRVLDVRLRDGRTVRIAPLICYDALDPRLALGAVRAGAELIVTLSNDSWFAAGTGPHLHLVGAAFRSVETRRPQLRATNTGISAVVTATGDIVATGGMDERAVLVGTVRPERRASTLVLAWGDWLGPVALVAAAVLIGGGRRSS